MNKKGFTLIELLAVIIILGIVMTLGITAFQGISNGTKEKMLETKIKMLEEAAIDYGQQKTNELTETCTVDGVNYKFCKLVTVKFLVDNKYMETEDRDDAGNLYIKNDVTNASMMNDTVQVYRKNNRVYAIMKEVKSNS